ncbi:DUF695 domain-containing protein [Methylomonas sp. SURF-1]|uniref:DUF695 domain-containing protein n=1 Tax=Methylomonas aurea TaxID=2952224 RepID=A0ABT1UHQ0_9GAMM|nr:DUF695 domain-containing protein [Methylomonas sp. SURF-1]MCQ8181768.1 DUF695 domain-containing protein [Methylomonas sp. SURF-1]
MNTVSEPSGPIVATQKEGHRILWTYVPEMPTEDVRRNSPWLTVVRWEYDGSGNNGMPETEVNQQMLMLEEALGRIERQEFFVEAYRRIGAGLREYVFYAADRDRFLAEFNEHVAAHPRYPIEIKFYEDKAWSDLQGLINDFSAA